MKGGGAGATAKFQGEIVAFQMAPRGVKRAFVAAHIGDRIGGIFARRPIPEARIILQGHLVCLSRRAVRLGRPVLAHA